MAEPSVRASLLYTKLINSNWWDIEYSSNARAIRCTAYRPASRANKKTEPNRYISVHTLFNNVCTFHEIYVAICTQHISCIYLDIHVCKQEIGKRHWCTCMYMVCKWLHKSKNVYTYINMYMHVWTMYLQVYTSKCMYMSIPCTYMFIYFQNCMYKSINFTKNMYMSEPCIWCVCTKA